MNSLTADGFFFSSSSNLADEKYSVYELGSSLLIRNENSFNSGANGKFAKFTSLSKFVTPYERSGTIK
ncbi:MAG: hypothetical protein SOZ24_00135 [Treponema sp.]|nr:hypothetical protein [Treponema sp.]